MKNQTFLSGDLTSWSFTVILAGLVGGFAEIVWVSLYSFLTPVSATIVAREITATFTSVDLSYAAMLGVCIHMVLAMALAVVFAAIILAPVARRYGTSGIILSCLMTLSIIWVINFHVVLPIINPAFTSLMPYVVTLISKLLFGAAMAWVLIAKSPVRGDINTKLNVATPI